MSICYLNGAFLELDKASISPLDRGFLFGDSVYEVIAAYKKNLFKIDDHLDRLEKNLKSLSINIDLENLEIESIVRKVCEKNSEENQIIYLQISRGVEAIRNHIPREDTEPTIFICSFELKNLPSENNDSIKAVLNPDIRWKKSSIKSNSLLANVLYKMQANDAGYDELLMSDNGFLTEGAVSNVFCVKKNKVFTPPLESNILPGVTRKIIIEIIRELNLSYEEAKIDEEFLFDSDELWITNTTKGILPVIELNKRKIGDGTKGEIYRLIMKAFLKKIEESII